MKFAFQNMRELLRLGRGSLADVAHVKVYVTSEELREAVNAEWVECCPDPHDRPARHTLVQDLRGGMLIQLEIVALVQ